MPVPAIPGIPFDGVLMALTLPGVALIGLATIGAYKRRHTGFKSGAVLAGFRSHFAHEWVIFTNRLGLLLSMGITVGKV